ncbi:MAG: site-2 protease family protein [Steroidobacteraceae bacterium]
MFAQSIRMGRILGIPIGVNYSWFIIFALITMSLATHFAGLHPHWTYAEHLSLGVATSILFFASVVLHELGHSVLALRYGIPVKSITLFVFGGVAQIGKEPTKPIHEFNIAFAGPIVSAGLGVFFYGVMLLARETAEGIAALAEWLSRINFLLAAFNLIPGFPLDGGRVLRSIIWKYTGSFERATALAAGSGQLFAYAFIMFGVWQALSGNLIGGLWIAFIGWFLLSAAQSTVLQAGIRSAMSGTTAREVMTSEYLSVSGSASVADLVENHFLRTGARCAMVMDDDRIRGLVTVHEIKRVPREEWSRTPLQSVMLGEDRLTCVLPDASVENVLETMSEKNINQMPVVQDGRLLGVVGRDRLLALIRTRLEFKT